MKQTVLSAFTACTMLGAATMGMPAAAEAQTVIIINGNQPYSQPYSYPYPQRHHVVYDYPGYYGAGYGAGGYYGAGYGAGGYYGAGYGGYYGGYYPAYGYGYRRPYWGW